MNIVLLNRSLNSDIWEQDKTLKKEVRYTLLKVARDFYKDTDLDLPIIDILLLGSMAGYNYSGPESDIDVHILIDTAQLNIDEQFLRPFLDGLSAKWDSSHQIKIKGHLVNPYIQDVNVENRTPGSYSLINDKWVKEPTSSHPVLNKNKIRSTYQSLKREIEQTLNSDDIEKIKQLWKKIKDSREQGLSSKDKEMSIQNIVFKILRIKGYLTKIKDKLSSLYNDSLSIPESTPVNYNKK